MSIIDRKSLTALICDAIDDRLGYLDADSSRADETNEALKMLKELECYVRNGGIIKIIEKSKLMAVARYSAIWNYGYADSIQNCTDSESKKQYDRSLKYAKRADKLMRDCGGKTDEDYFAGATWISIHDIK